MGLNFENIKAQLKKWMDDSRNNTGESLDDDEDVFLSMENIEKEVGNVLAEQKKNWMQYN